MLFPSKQSKQTTPPKGSSKFLLRSRTKEKSRVSRSFASLTPSPPKERRSSEEKNKRENHPTSSCSVPLGPTAAAFPSAPLQQRSPRPHCSSLSCVFFTRRHLAAFPSAPLLQRSPRPHCSSVPLGPALLKSFVCFSILFLPTATTDKFTVMLGFASRTPIATNRAMIGPQLRQSKQSIFTQRKVTLFVLI
jgi:hypothetical protein